MKILFIGHYRDNCEEGELSRSYLRACNSLGHELIARPIFLSPDKYPVEEDIIELENKWFDSAPDLVIQNVRPHFMQKTHFRNLGIIFDDISYNDLIIDKLNLMDGLLVQNNSKFLNKILDIPVYDVGYYVQMPNEEKQPLNIEDTNVTYNFYFIDEYCDRTNLLPLIVAFNSEFSVVDNVRLIIYAWTNDLKNSSQNIIADIKNIKSKMKIFHKNHYSEEIIITPQPFQKEIDSLHMTGDCLVIPTNRSCYNPHMAKALYFGNTVLCTDNVGVSNFEYLTKIQSYPSISIDNRDQSNATDVCFNPCLIQLQRLMRQQYSLGKSKLIRVNQFTIESVSTKIQNALNKLYN